MSARHIHSFTLLFSGAALVLLPILAMEDASYWGQLQWFAFTFVCAAIGAAINRAWHLRKFS